jgi:hypothetical protein
MWKKALIQKVFGKIFLGNQLHEFGVEAQHSVSAASGNDVLCGHCFSYTGVDKIMETLRN